MKQLLYTFFAALLTIALYGCSSSQMSMYKPSENAPGWRVDVTKKAGLPDEFICTINDTAVIKASFPLLGDSFEKQGTFRGKKVVMSGYMNSTTNSDSNGHTTTVTRYQIRVFIDDKLVDKFDF